MTLSRGVDVSHHQGVVDWPALKRAHGLTWAACKATEGTGFLDSRFARNWREMKAAGLVRMAYHFARPERSSGERQARYFLDVVRPVAGDVLCLDLEESDLDQAHTNAWAKDFANTLRRLAPGHTTVAYLGGYAANGSGAGLSPYFDYWWYPRYATNDPVTAWPTTYAPRLARNTTGWDAPHIWQWAASLRGLPGLPVDANVSPLTAEQLRDGPAGSTPPEDDMPLTQEDAELVASALLRKSVQVGLEQWTVAQAIGRAAANSRNAVTALDAVADPDRIAAAVAEALPQGTGLTQEQVTVAFVDALKQLAKEAQ